MESVFLETERFALRPLEKQDVEGPYVTWLNDEEASRGNSHHVFPYTIDNAIQYIESTHGSKKDLVLAITVKESKKHIGNITLQGIHWINRTAEFAILIGEKDWWGKGVGKEAGLQIVRHGFETLGLNKIQCGTFESNEGMIRLAGALGMEPEGRRRQAVFKGGRFQDVLEFGVLKNEWAGINR